MGYGPRNPRVAEVGLKASEERARTIGAARHSLSQINWTLLRKELSGWSFHVNGMRLNWMSVFAHIFAFRQDKAITFGEAGARLSSGAAFLASTSGRVGYRDFGNSPAHALHRRLLGHFSVLTAVSMTEADIVGAVAERTIKNGDAAFVHCAAHKHPQIRPPC